MRYLLIAALVWHHFVAYADDPRIKSWKTLTNVNGFEFKYPDCWTVRTDSPDEIDVPVTMAQQIIVEESKNCARRLSNPPHANLVGFSGGIIKSTPEENRKDIASKEKRMRSNLEQKLFVFFKHIKLGSDDALLTVPYFKGVEHTAIYWEMNLYCPTVRVSYSGPAIRNPDPSYFEKFKAGDMAMPEPEKTIFESIRCVTPKSK